MSIDFGLLVSTFILITVSEIGDKSQLVAFSLSSQGYHPAALFLGSACALVCSSLLAAIAGQAASSLLPRVLPWFSGGLFILIGLFILLKKDKPGLEDYLVQLVERETTLARQLDLLIKRNPALPEVIQRIAQQESRHAHDFELLFAGKEMEKLLPLPPDDIIQALQDWEENALPAERTSLKDMLPFIIQIEETGYQFYRFLENELAQKKGHQALKNHLRETLREEDEHRAVWHQLAAEWEESRE